MIRQDIDKTSRRVHQFPAVDRIDDLLTRAARQEALALAHDRDLECSQLRLGPRHLRLGPGPLGCALLHDLIRCVLKRLEAPDQDRREL